MATRPAIAPASPSAGLCTGPSATPGACGSPGAFALAARLAAGLRLFCVLAAVCASSAALAFDAGQLASREIPAAHLIGQGSFTRMGFHLYDAALFSGSERIGANWSAHPLVLDLRYARSFKSHTLVQRTLVEMTKLQVATDAERQHWAEQLSRILPDVSAGQHLTGVFLPGDGTRFFSDGKLIGQIAGDAFGRAFFAIWLDPRTSAPDLRAELVSNSR
ncbi:chalcone isomerase family protein [Pandoraea sp. CB10b_02]|uniref:chalcone isomerase family protein n=1 Tax=Pandoraea sp. CB10b_02 TaxID=2014535 RepID=UPI002580A646|nr:chalcone isomerase family protein [Pandoraea sp. CB10b_02]